jgi:hypothetical protein
MRFQSLVVIFIVMFALVAADEEFHPIDVSNPYMIKRNKEYNKKQNTSGSKFFSLCPLSRFKTRSATSSPIQTGFHDVD